MDFEKEIKQALHHWDKVRTMQAEYDKRYRVASQSRDEGDLMAVNRVSALLEEFKLEQADFMYHLKKKFNDHLALKVRHYN